MQGRNSFEDELARRRALRMRRRMAEQQQAQGEEDEEKPPELGWKDILALTIAAYQVLFPMVLAMGAALFLAYLLFRFYFS